MGRGGGLTNSSPIVGKKTKGARLWITLKRFSKKKKKKKKKKKRKKKSSRRDRCCFLSRLEFRIERNPGSFQTWPSNEERLALPTLVAKSVVL